jgi:hypothetical protein
MSMFQPTPEVFNFRRLSLLPDDFSPGAREKVLPAAAGRC